MGVLTDAAAFLVALAALATSAGMLSRLRAVRWLWRRLVGEPFDCWFGDRVGKAVTLVMDRKLNGSLDGLKHTLDGCAEGLDDLRDRTGRIEAKLAEDDS